MKRKVFMKTAGGGGFPRLARVMTCLMLMLTGLGTGAWAQGTVTLKEGTEDADKWEVKSGTTTVVLDTTAAGLKAACEIVSIVIE